jgi:DNA-binding transcriptional LysR family regulator
MDESYACVTGATTCPNLGLKLFERRPRSLTLTEDGQALYRIATEMLDRLQAATDQLRMETRARQLSITRH